MARILCACIALPELGTGGAVRVPRMECCIFSKRIEPTAGAVINLP